MAPPRPPTPNPPDVALGRWLGSCRPERLLKRVVRRRFKGNNDNRIADRLSEGPEVETRVIRFGREGSPHLGPQRPFNVDGRPRRGRGKRRDGPGRDRTRGIPTRAALDRGNPRLQERGKGTPLDSRSGPTAWRPNVVRNPGFFPALFQTRNRPGSLAHRGPTCTVLNLFS